MKTKTKAVFLSVCAIAVVAASIVGTVAYFTDKNTVTNTFTVGNVNISLKEHKVERNETTGKFEKLTETTESGVDYGVVYPGDEIPKDPTVTVGKDSSDAWVVAKVTVKNSDLDNPLLGFYKDTWGGVDLTGFVAGGICDNAMKSATAEDTAKSGDDFLFYNDDYWLGQKKITVKAATETTPEEAEWEFTYYFKTPKSKDTEIVLFENVNIPETWGNEAVSAIGNVKIEVTAYAIQAQGFDDIFTAWNAVKEQYSAN